MASIKCVRPIFTMSSHFRAFASSALARFSMAPMSWFVIATAAATCIAVGKVSLDD